jgi:hypothetical protein
VGQLGRRQIAAFETREPLHDDAGRPVPCVSRAGRGGAVDVYVYGDHEVFREYGRDPRDYALIEVAEVLRLVARDTTRLANVVAEVTRQLPDQRMTDAALRERAETLLSRIRTSMLPLVVPHSTELWSLLPNECKRAAERDASNAAPRLHWKDATDDGAFVAYLDPVGIANLVTSRPDLFLDGSVFSTRWASWSDDAARERQPGRLSRMLETIGEFRAHTGQRTRMELVMARLTLDVLYDELAVAD